MAHNGVEVEMKKLSFASIAMLLSFVGLWEGQRTTAYQEIV